MTGPMTGKRKRHRKSKPDSPHCKRLKTDRDPAASLSVTHPTLSLYYPRVFTLRTHVLSRLPTSSKTRRRKIAGLGKHATAGKPGVERETDDDTQSVLVQLLDRALVCRKHDELEVAAYTRGQDFRAFSQRNGAVDESSLLEGSTPQSEIVDFAIWLLFHRIHRTSHKPPHILCHGYQRASAPVEDVQGAISGIPGIIVHYPNSHVATLKSRPWSDVLNLLGKDGEQIMLELILGSALYAAVESGEGNYYQLCGVPLTDLQPLASYEATQAGPAPAQVSFQQEQAKRSTTPSSKAPSSIVYVRNRMFYARAALNAKGKVRFGLRHIHVLNRYPDPLISDHTTHILKYIFPRQFGLHNVFTSTVDPKQTAQPFQDYTLREHEIALKAGNLQNASQVKPHLPKRLRGKVFDLVRKMQKMHSRCAYYELLRHYCPLSSRKLASRTLSRAGAPDNSNTTADASQSRSALKVTFTEIPIAKGRLAREPANLETPVVDHATPVSGVSAFCRAVLANLVPNDFWGQGVDGDDNRTVIMHQIDRFIRLRRFESLTLHAVYQSLKIGSMTWLAPSHIPSDAGISSSDLNKRRELLFEFLYYLFDSIIIPLIRSNFHVTESNLHKNRMFYFRHDVWRALTEPAMTRIKNSMLEEVPTMKARQLLDARTLGFSQIRLLPKATGLRPIMNLRRRMTKLQGGKAVLGRSINSIMAPVHKMFDLERHQNPQSIGSALFSVGDMYPKLRAFQDRLRSGTDKLPTLYFAKVDVQSCFDTIPQRDALKVMEQLISENVYRIARHAQIKAVDPRTSGSCLYTQTKPARKFLASAHLPLDFRSFDEMVEETLASERKNTIFVDNVLRTAHKKQKLIYLLRDHVGRNMIKIGKKFFRQRDGIPQGSVLSSLLCNCFYAKLEQEHLSFIDGEDSLLLRLIDDFLLITTDKTQAVQFFEVMHNGIGEYGVRVNPAKSLSNFDVKMNGTTIARTKIDWQFPYCGTTVDTRTLEISKDRDRRKVTTWSDSLTVEQSRTPGQIFHRKAMNALKIQMQKMFLDTNFNSISHVLNNIYENFIEAAMKYYRYVKLMKASRQPKTALLMETIQSMIDMAFLLTKAKHRSQPSQEYACAVNKRQLQWLALTAFDNVLRRKQTSFQLVLAWVRKTLEEVRPKDGNEALKLVKVAQKGQLAFRGLRY